MKRINKYYLLIPVLLILLIFGFSNLPKKNLNLKKSDKLKSIKSKLKPKKIFVFDFDLTLTLKDTETVIVKNGFSLKEIFGNHLDSLKGLFKKINEKSHIIFINTANSVNKVKKILTKADLINFIEKIYGASSKEEITNPTEHSDLWKKKRNISVKHKWALTKRHYLNKIKNQYSKSTIYFFDDLDINIEKSKECLEHCYMVKKGNIPALINKVSEFLK